MEILDFFGSALALAVIGYIVYLMGKRRGWWKK